MLCVNFVCKQGVFLLFRRLYEHLGILTKFNIKYGKINLQFEIFSAVCYIDNGIVFSHSRVDCIYIYRPFGRNDTMDRGYGNGETDVGQLISNYIYGVGGYRW